MLSLSSCCRLAPLCSSWLPRSYEFFSEGSGMPLSPPFAFLPPRCSFAPPTKWETLLAERQVPCFGVHCGSSSFPLWWFWVPGLGTTEVSPGLQQVSASPSPLTFFNGAAFFAAYQDDLARARPYSSASPSGKRYRPRRSLGPRSYLTPLCPSRAHYLASGSRSGGGYILCVVMVVSDALFGKRRNVDYTDTKWLSALQSQASF